MTISQDIKEAVGAIRSVLLGVFIVGFILGILWMFADKVPFLNETLGATLRTNQGFFDTVILILLVLAVVIGAGAALKVLSKTFGE